MAERVRALGEYEFEDGGKLTIKLIGPTPTDEVLDMAQKLIDLKRKELAGVKDCRE